MIREKEKIINIVQDFLVKNDVIVNVFIDFNEEWGEKAKVCPSNENEFEHFIVYNPELWDEWVKPKCKSHIDYAGAIVSTMLHEATHIICNHRNLNSTDKQEVFEKMIYENYLNSNCDYGDEKHLAELLGITKEEYIDYLKNKREELFFTEYINYVNYLLGYADSIEGTVKI